MSISNTWTREHLAYAAGLFEGEGNVATGKNKAPRLVIDSTDLDVLRRFHQCVGVGTICGPYVRGGGREHCKPIWRWHVQSKAKAYALMVALYPFLGERRRARIAQVIQAWLSQPVHRAARS